MVDLTPFKVEFRMETPICLTYPFIHFDGLIAHLWLRKKDSHFYRSLPSKKVVNVLEKEDNFPLKKTGDIYHASISFFDIKDAFTTKIYKKFCEKYLDLKRIRKKKIDKTRGHFKDHMISLVYVPARKVIFYGCGDVSTIDDLLKNLAGLGKKTSIGYGFIKDYKIKEIKDDLSVVKEGIAMRPIPKEMLKEWSELVLMAYKPPYWAKENVKLCAPPGACVKISSNLLKLNNKNK